MAQTITRTQVTMASTFESRMAPRQVSKDIETLRDRAGGVKNTQDIFKEAFAGRDPESLRQGRETGMDILARVLREAVAKEE